MMTIEESGLQIGALVDVKYLGKTEKGRIRLSRRAALLRDSGKE